MVQLTSTWLTLKAPGESGAQPSCQESVLDCSIMAGRDKSIAGASPFCCCLFSFCRSLLGPDISEDLRPIPAPNSDISHGSPKWTTYQNPGFGVFSVVRARSCRWYSIVAESRTFLLCKTRRAFHIHFFFFNWEAESGWSQEKGMGISRHELPNWMCIWRFCRCLRVFCCSTWAASERVLEGLAIQIYDIWYRLIDLDRFRSIHIAGPMEHPPFPLVLVKGKVDQLSRRMNVCNQYH